MAEAMFKSPNTLSKVIQVNHTKKIILKSTPPQETKMKVKKPFWLKYALLLFPTLLLIVKRSNQKICISKSTQIPP